MSGDRAYIERICRTCAEEKENLVNIFSQVGTDEILVTMFDVHISIDDPLPKNICIECEERIKDAIVFKQNCMLSEDFLQKIFQKEIDDLVIVEDTRELELAIGNVDPYDEEPNPIEELTEPVESKLIVIDDSDDDINIKREEITDFGESDLEENSSSISFLKKPTQIELIPINNLIEPSTSGKLQPQKIFRAANELPGTLSFPRKEPKRLKVTGPPFKCSKCTKEFGWRNGLVRHLETHDEKRERKYKCIKCTKAFFTSQHLREHYYYIHMSHKGFRCDICQHNFKRKPDLKRHIQRHKIAIDDNEEENNIIEDDVQIITDATEIKPVYQISEVIPTRAPPHENMLQWKLLNEADGNSIFSSLFKNSRAAIELPDALSFPRRKPERLKVTGPPFKCNKCTKEFGWRNHLMQHLEIHDEKRERKYKCMKCTKTFCTSQHLREHYYYIHIDHKGFICDICHRNFKRKPDLKRHIQRHKIAIDDNEEENSIVEDDVQIISDANKIEQISDVIPTTHENMLQWKLLNEADGNSIFSSLFQNT